MNSNSIKLHCCDLHYSYIAFHISIDPIPISSRAFQLLLPALNPSEPPRSTPSYKAVKSLQFCRVVSAPQTSIRSLLFLRIFDDTRHKVTRKQLDWREHNQLTKLVLRVKYLQYNLAPC